MFLNLFVKNIEVEHVGNVSVLRARGYFDTHGCSLLSSTRIFLKIAIRHQ